MIAGTIVYTKTIGRNFEQESGQQVTLTRELNRLILWRKTWSIDNDELLVIKHWHIYDDTVAIEFSVDYARGLLAEPAAPAGVHHCRNCGEPCPSGADCCDDDPAEPGDIRETGR